MNQTSTLLKQLREAYPNLTFDTVRKSLSAFADDDRYADLLIGVVTDDFLIISPFDSECGRFTVSPDIEYGIPKEVADKIVQHNVSPSSTQSTPSDEEKNA